MKKILLLQIALVLLLCSMASTPPFGQRKAKPQRPKKSKPVPSPANDVFADAKTLTTKEKEYVLKILMALDGSDAIFSTSLDPYRFKNSLERVIKMTEDVDKNLHKGMVRNALTLTTLAYLDFGVLVNLGATRHMPLTKIGWRVQPARPAFPDQPGTRPATEDDVLAVKDFLSINVGDPAAPAGLYASNHDMFAFLINEENRIDDGSDSGLSRGVFFENSEVGAKALPTLKRTCLVFKRQDFQP